MQPVLQTPVVKTEPVKQKPVVSNPFAPAAAPDNVNPFATAAGMSLVFGASKKLEGERPAYQFRAEDDITDEEEEDEEEDVDVSDLSNYVEDNEKGTSLFHSGAY